MYLYTFVVVVVVHIVFEPLFGHGHAAILFQLFTVGVVVRCYAASLKDFIIFILYQMYCELLVFHRDEDCTIISGYTILIPFCMVNGPTVSALSIAMLTNRSS